MRLSPSGKRRAFGVRFQPEEQVSSDHLGGMQISIYSGRRRPPNGQWQFEVHWLTLLHEKQSAGMVGRGQFLRFQRWIDEIDRLEPCLF